MGTREQVRRLGGTSSFICGCRLPDLPVSPICNETWKPKKRRTFAQISGVFKGYEGMDKGDDGGLCPVESSIMFKSDKDYHALRFGNTAPPQACACPHNVREPSSTVSIKVEPPSFRASIKVEPAGSRTLIKLEPVQLRRHHRFKSARDTRYIIAMNCNITICMLYVPLPLHESTPYTTEEGRLKTFATRNIDRGGVRPCGA
jgi:hypothetical protein